MTKRKQPEPTTDEPSYLVSENSAAVELPGPTEEAQLPAEDRLTAERATVTWTGEPMGGYPTSVVTIEQLVDEGDVAAAFWTLLEMAGYTVW